MRKIINKKRQGLGQKSLKDIARVILFPLVFLRRILRFYRLKNFSNAKVLNIAYRGNKFAIVVDPKNGFIDKTIYIERAWDAPVGEAISRFLKSGYVFVDIGANIGFFSLLASRIVSEKGRVFSFEPIPHCAEQIERSIHLNNISNIKIFRFACGSNERTSKIYLNPRNIGGSSLSNKVGKSGKLNLSEGLNVDIVRLDSVLMKEGRIDVIKIDVEGMEYDVLLGAQGILKRYRPVLIMEYSPCFYEQIEKGLSEKFVNFIIESNYIFFNNAENKIIDIAETTKELLESKNQLDIVVFPAERLHELLGS